MKPFPPLRRSLLLACALGPMPLAGAATPAVAEAERVRLAVDTARPIGERLDALRRLEVAETEQGIAALEPLLDDPATHLLARRVLTGMANPAAGAALRSALARSRDPLRTVGLLQSLGMRRDADAEALVAARCSDADPQVRRAALRALGEIGTPGALRRLQALPATPDDRDVREVAVLAAAQSNVGTTEAYEAWSSLRREGLPSSRAAATLALGRLSRLSPAQWADALVDAAPEIRDAAVALAGTGIGGGRVPTPQLMERLPPETQAQLLEVLAERGPPAGVAALRRGLGSPHLPVRAAAARGLGERRDTDSADALLAVAFNDDAVGAAARTALRLLPTSRVDDALIGRVAAGPVRERAWSVEVLAGRGYRPLVPVLLDTGFLEDPVLRSATMEAWRQLAGEADVPGMLAFALRVDAGLRGAVAAVVGQVVRRADDPAGVVRALDLHLRGATAAVRAEMIPLYALVPGPEAVASLALQAGPGDAEVRRAAVRALARHGSTEALRALHALSADPEVGAEARALLERRP